MQAAPPWRALLVVCHRLRPCSTWATGAVVVHPRPALTVATCKWRAWWLLLCGVVCGGKHCAISLCCPHVVCVWLVGPLHQAGLELHWGSGLHSLGKCFWSPPVTNSPRVRRVVCVSGREGLSAVRCGQCCRARGCIQTDTMDAAGGALGLAEDTFWG